MLAGENLLTPITAMSITTGGTSAKWDSQRKEAKSLENALDTLLASLSSKASSYTAASATGESSSEGSVKATEISDLERKVEEALAKLTRVVNDMSDAASNFGANGGSGSANTSLTGGSSASLLHTVQRHRDILFDYNQEFKRMKQNIKMKREQSELLSYVKQDISSYKESHGISDTDILLNERGHLDNSHSLADTILQNAYDTRSQLQQQRSTMLGTSRRAGGITSRFPAINSILRRVHLKKRKDSIIIALVTAICIAGIVIYKFS